MVLALSKWSSRHRLASRLLFTLSLIFLTVAALFLGLLLSAWGIQVPVVLLYLLWLPVLAAFYFYPARSGRPGQETFVVRKRWDVLMFSITFLMVAGWGSQTQQQQYVAWNSQASAYAASSHAIVTTEQGQKKSSQFQKIWNSSKNFKQRLVRKVQQFSAWASDMSQGSKIWGTVLVILVSIGLIYLLAAVSCGIVCSGLEFLGIALFTLGTVAILFFAIRTIRYFYKGKRKAGSVF